MAIFGTPTVIGTLSNSTSQTTYTVPITATTTQSDCIVVIVSSGGSGSNNIPSSVTDSQNTGLTYQQTATTSGSGQITYLRLYNSKILTSADTVTVTFPSANSFLKNIAVIDCPGAIADDLASIAVNSGTSTSPTISSTLSTSYELVIFAQNNGNAGGAPSGFSPLTNLATLHSGSAIYTTISYQIVTSSGSYTATDTIASSGWSTIVVGMVSSLPIFFNQNPFPTFILPPAQAFNPALSSLRPQAGQPPVPTVISSAPISISGAQSNVFTPGVNSLKGDAANFSASTGNWTNGGNTTIVQTGSVSHNAQGALQATATAGGSITILSSTSGKIQANGLPASNGDTIFAAGWVLAASVSRNAQIGFSMLDINGTVLGSTVFGTAVADSSGVWTLITSTGVVNQANTAYVRVNVQWSSALAAEVHYISDVVLFDVTSGSGMGEQIQIFTPSNQQFQLQPNGVPYPLSLNFQLSNLRRQMQTAPFAVFQPGAVSAANVSAITGTPAILQTFWPQFPWQNINPSIQFNPSLSILRPQYSTANPTTFIDGGAGGQVSVTASFPDIAVTISVSATQNVSVTAPVPPIVLNGPATNISVAASAPSLNETLTGRTSAVSVASIAGLTDLFIAGVTSGISVASSGQTINISSFGNAANVNASMAGDNIVVIKMGTTGLVSVASSGSSSTSVQGNSANANVSAVSGSMSISEAGTTANVSVASVEGAAITITGAAANANVAAIAGLPVKGYGPLSAVNVTVTAYEGGAATTAFGVVSQITVNAVAGSASVSVPASDSQVSVSAFSGQAGLITITGFLVNLDLSDNILMSRQGKLLEIPVTNMLVSASPPPVPQGI